jgi:hypothetical protein
MTAAGHRTKPLAEALRGVARPVAFAKPVDDLHTYYP